MIKILQINATVNWGSTGKIAEQIGLCAMSHGFKSYIAYGRYMNYSKSNLIKIGSRLSVYEHYAENRILGNEGLASRYVTKRLIKTIDKINPDIIHLHNIHDHIVNYRILFEYLNSIDIPIVWSFHDCWAFTGDCYFFDEIDCEKWKTECSKCPVREGLIDRSRFHFNLKKELFCKKNNLVIVPVSEWIGELVGESFLKDKPMVVIKNGIDLNVFKPYNTDLRKRLGIPDDKIVVLGVALPWSTRKGMKDFVKMAEDTTFQIVLVGISAQQKNNIPSSIISVPKTSNQKELAEYYSMADVFVNATYSDNYPTTNLEAMACGTPVITYRTGGSVESISNGTGLVIKQGDIKGLEKAVQYIYDKQISPKICRDRAEELFDKNKCYEKYIDLYSRLLHNKD